MQRVTGELYKVDSETLDTLDQLECHPVFYVRDTLDVTLNSAPSDPVQCHAYFMRNFRREVLATETLLREYRDTPERPYVLTRDREPGVMTQIMDIKEQNSASS